jgi:hypothetical protein
MPASPPRLRWLWFFLALAALAAAAVVIPIVYNIGLQLTPEQLEQARALWDERGPKDYDLEYAEKLDPDTRIFIYRVKVRGGRAVAFGCNGEPELLDEAAGLALGSAVRMRPPGDFQEHTVDGLLRRMAAALAEDRRAARQGGRRNYATARFDRQDGHPLHYVRRVAGSRERLEWNVRLHPVTGE